jgi:hypothetical protein
VAFLDGFARKLGVLEYKGTWNATTNTPALSNATGKKGEYYVCSTGGKAFLEADAGDWLIHNGSVWQRLDVMDKSSVAPANTVYESNTQVFADGSPGTADPSGREGWYFKNATAGQKVNWYFFSYTQQTVQYGQVSSFWMVVTVYQTRLPFLSLYTLPQADGLNAAAWYRSRVSYVGTNPATPGTYLLHFGADPGVYPGLQRIPLTREPSSARGPEGASEVVMTALLSSDSAASANTVEFVCPHAGFQGNTVNFRIQSSMNIETAKQNVEKLEAKVLELERRLAALGG